MKFLIATLIIAAQSPLSFAKNCNTDFGEFQENHLEFEYAISPTQEVYTVLASNVEGTKAIIEGNNVRYSDFSSLYDSGTDYNKACPTPVDVKLLKGFNGVDHITVNGNYIRRNDSVLLKDKVKATYLGKTLDRQLVFNQLSEYRGNKKYRPNFLKITTETAEITLFRVEDKYQNCDIKRMQELVDESTSVKFFYGKNTNKLIRKCEKKGFATCSSGEFDRKNKEDFSLSTYLKCKATVHPYQKHVCRAYATTNKVSSKNGVVGVTFNENEFYNKNPSYCKTLNVCIDSTKGSRELMILKNISDDLNCR